jgi:UDP-4-amino-4,6-dideoxy-N-acetyl-beta-L-altrosamine N-acetyltransferase
MEYKKFQDLSLEEKKEVLKWRNHPEIRKWMVDKKLNINNEIIKFDDIGVITIKHFKEYVYLGIFKNPLKHGVGGRIMEFALKYIFEVLKKSKIIIYVKESNKQAIHLYEKFGFEKVDSYKNIVKMRNYDTFFNK